MRKPKPEIPTSKTQTWAPARGLDVNITISAKDATLYRQEQKRS